MTIKTNLNSEHKEKLQSLINKELMLIIFFQTKPNISGGYFPSKEQAFSFYGERVAFVFKMSPPSLEHIPLRKRHKTPKQTQYEVLSIKCNNFDTDSFIMGDMGAHIWNLDFHFDTIIGNRNAYNPFPETIDEVELIELVKETIHNRIIKNSHTVFSNIRQNANKIQVFGMKEYFENIEKVDFENMPYPNRKPFENYKYPIDINLISSVIISLSKETYLLIKGGEGNGVNITATRLRSDNIDTQGLG